MTKLHLSAPQTVEKARTRRPWLLLALVAAIVGYTGWLFVRTPMLAGTVLAALRNSVGL